MTDDELAAMRERIRADVADNKRWPPLTWEQKRIIANAMPKRRDRKML